MCCLGSVDPRYRQSITEIVGMDADDEKISTLMAVRFPDITEIIKAQNDLNEAVSILKNDQPPPLQSFFLTGSMKGT